MAEDDSGFTFVDKRHTEASGADEQPPVGVPQGAAEAASDVSESDPEDGAAPSIYGVLGYCISILATEAWKNLGLLADPQTGEAVTDLIEAKVAIDAVSDLASRLEAAPVEAVPDTLRRDLKTLVNDLRLNYVARRDDASASRN